MIELGKLIEKDLLGSVQNFEYLLEIDNRIFVATRKQMLKINLEDSQAIYYEDADMKISNIIEKIDLKTKKPQLASTTITFSNYPYKRNDNDVRFSDRFSNLIGKRIKIYFKTQSCKQLTDCLLVSQLKITRIDHDQNTIKIIANDLSLDSLLKDIPNLRNILLSGINTFDHYSGKPIPTLYGHLESAPAIVYVEEINGEQKISLLPDTSYIEGDQIGGVPNFNRILFYDGEDNEHNGNILTDKIQLIRQNIVKIGLGDNICDVPCLPYQQTRDAIVRKQENESIVHTNEQWFTQGNKVLFNVDFDENRDEVIDNANLWCSKNEIPYADECKSYHIESSTQNFMGAYTYGSITDNEFNDDKTMFLQSIYRRVIGAFLRNKLYTMGVQQFKFNPLSGYNINQRENNEGIKLANTDIHFVGSLKLNQYAENLTIRDVSTKIHSVYSKPVHNSEANLVVSETENYPDKFLDSNFKEFIGFPQSIQSDIISAFDDRVFEEFEELRRTTIKCRGYKDLEEQSWVDYRSSFVSNIYTYEDDNSFISRYTEQNYYPILDATTLTLYYFTIPESFDEGGNNPISQKTIEANWRDIQIRKIWNNEKIFDNNFYLNAKGKLGQQEQNVKSINGYLIVRHEAGLESDYINSELQGYDNKHFTELYKILTDSNMKTKKIDGDIYTLALASYDEDNDTYSYIYDIEVTNLSFRYNNAGYNQSLPTGIIYNRTWLYPYTDSNIIQTGQNTGWIIKIEANYFGQRIQIPQTDFERTSRGLRLVYIKKLYENNDIVNIEYVEHEDLDVFNNSNRYEFETNIPDPYQLDAEFGYTTAFWEKNPTNTRRLIEKPHEIIQSLLQIEGESEIEFDQSKINNILQQAAEYKFAFSINKKQNTRKIIEKICQQSPFYYRYRGRDTKIVVDMLNNTYTQDDVDSTIDVKYITKFSFNRTKIEDTCMGGVTINYEYDYQTDNYKKRTPKRQTLEYFQDYKDYYGVDSLESYEIEIDAPYIQDQATAEFYRDYYYELNKQQKLTCKFTLPMKYAIQYEVGDIIEFSDNPNNTKPYGKDITTEYTNIDQVVLPYFFITKITKSLFEVNVECVQIHELNYDQEQTILLGDLDQDGQITTNDFVMFQEIFQELLNEYIDEFLETDRFTFEQVMSLGYTMEQAVLMDLTQDGFITVEDGATLQNIINQ